MSTKNMSGKSAAKLRSRQAGDDVYLPKKGDLGFEDDPACIFFYYIGPDPNNKPYVREYYYTEGVRRFRMRDDVEDAVRILTRNAREDEDDQAPPPCGANWKHMVWTRKSYIAILIDDPWFTFRHKGVIFDRRFRSLPNHSFYDAWHKKLNIPRPDGIRRDCPVVCFINHMKDSVGGDLDRRAQRFHFDLYTHPELVEVAPAGVRRVARPRYPDSGGTNMGPPVPPP